MYIDFIKIRDFRCFKETELQLRHPSEDVALHPNLRCRNVNLLLGDNGAGKTSILKALALAVLGPVIRDSGYRPYYLVRRTGRTKSTKKAIIDAKALMHSQDHSKVGPASDDRTVGLSLHAEVFRRGDYESIASKEPPRAGQAIFFENSPAFFVAGYGATRRVDEPTSYSTGESRKSRSARYQRVAGLFEPHIALVPLTSWLVQLKTKNKGRFSQVQRLLNQLLPAEAEFSGSIIDRDFSFKVHGQEVPFSALSDGYRAYIGWVADLLHHVLVTCPSGYKLSQNRGLVLVDEIDLHLHPNWQRMIIHQVSKALPNIQFVFTTHSPLVAASLQTDNIFVSETDEDGVANMKQYGERIFGLSADQALESSYFGVPSTRAEGFLDEMRELTSEARLKDPKAALTLMDKISGISGNAQSRQKITAKH